MPKQRRRKYGTYNEKKRKRLKHERNRYDKNDYNSGVTKVLSDNEDVEENEGVYNEDSVGDDISDDNEHDLNEIGDGNHVVNNIIPPQKYEDTSSKKNNPNVGSNAMDVLQTLYNDIANCKQNIHLYTREFLKGEEIQVDEKYDNNIKDANKQKDNLKLIAAYKVWDNKLSIPLTRLFEQMNKKGMISVTKFEDFYNGPFTEFREGLLDSFGNKDAPDMLKIFAEKSLQYVEKIDKNCGYSFDPTKMRHNIGVLYGKVYRLRTGPSVLDILINLICGLTNFNDFFQDLASVETNLKGLYGDVESYYNKPLNKRQEVVDVMNSKLSLILTLLSRIKGIDENDIKIIEKMQADLKEAMSTEVDASGIVVDFIIAFGGKAALKNVNIKSINKDVYDRVLFKLADSIKDSCDLSKDENLSKDESIKIAASILNKEEKPEDISENVAAFYDGKVNSEYDKMIDFFNKKSSMEDAKINGNRNLQKVDAINKKTSGFISSLNKYVSSCLANINDLEKKYFILQASGCLGDNDSMREVINSLVEQLLTSIDIEADRCKSFYEYIDDKNEREKVVNGSEEKFKKLKEDIKQSEKNYLFNDEGKPKPGKEAEIEQVDDMLGNMKDIPKLCFNSWEYIHKTVEKVKNRVRRHIIMANDDKQLRMDKKRKKTGKNNLFHLAKSKANIENNLLHKMMDFRFSNLDRGRRPLLID